MQNQVSVNAARDNTQALRVSSNQSQYFVTRDGRYTWAREFTGHVSGQQRRVVRFLGERVADFEADDLRSVRDCIATHAQQRLEHARLIQLSWDSNRRFAASHWLGDISTTLIRAAYIMRDGSVMTSAIDVVRSTKLENPDEIIHTIEVRTKDDTANGGLCFNSKYSDVVWC